MKSKKVRILIDHQAFSIQNYGGITAYFEGLLPNFKKFNIDYSISVLVSSNYQIYKISKHFFLKINAIFVKKYMKYIYFIINSIYTIFCMKLTKFDLYHATYYEPFFLKFLGKKPLVLTIYDCAYEEMGDNQNWKSRIIKNRRKIIDRSDAIIAISNDVKMDILKYYNVSFDKVHVIHLFSPLENKVVENRYKASKIKDRYILYVGTREFNKNFVRFLESYKKINNDDNSIKLVCAGGISFSANEKKLIEKLGLKSVITQVSYSTDNDLISLYQKAILFVCPSLKEGFGIPILNSFVCGCPVVASDILVFKEIAKDAYTPFDSRSVSSIYEAIKLNLTNNRVVQTNIRKGYKYAKL